MISLRVVCAVAFACAASCPAGELTAGAGETSGAPRRPTLAEKFLGQADRVLAQPTSKTYRHRTRVVEAAGVYETDCKGLIAFLLRKVSPAHLAAVPAPVGRKQPRALEYFDFFLAQPPVGQASTTGWNRVRGFANVLPGDLLAWRHRENTPGRNTGHVLIADSSPEATTEENIYRIAVIDAPGELPGEVTRSKRAIGIGRGFMWFRANADGEPIAYKRSSDSGFKSAPIVMGRMTEK